MYAASPWDLAFYSSIGVSLLSLLLWHDHGNPMFDDVRLDGLKSTVTAFLFPPCAFSLFWMTLFSLFLHSAAGCVGLGSSN